MDTLEKLHKHRISHLNEIIKQVSARRNSRWERYEKLLEANEANEHLYEQFKIALESKQALLSEVNGEISEIDLAMKEGLDSDYVLNLTKSLIKKKKERSNLNADIDERQINLHDPKKNHTSNAQRLEIVKKLKDMDDHIYTSLVAIKDKLEMVFIRQELLVGHEGDGTQTYVDFIEEVVDFIERIIESMG